MSEATQTKRPRKGLIILIAGIGVLLVAVIVLLVVLLLRKPATDLPVAANPGTGNVVADDSFNPNAMVEKAAENMFEVKMNADWYFPDGSSEAADAFVANSTANHAPFYFDVLLADTEEVIYTSPIIPLGSAVKGITLTKPLEQGNYECVVRYNILAEDDTVANVVSVTANVHIES